MRKKSGAESWPAAGRGEWPISELIEELESQGFEISAVAGTSMGALVGGRLCLGASRTFQAMVVRTRQIQGFQSGGLRPEHRGAGQGRPCDECHEGAGSGCGDRADARAVRGRGGRSAHGREVVLDRGGLYDAIRASISIPSVFKPVHRDGQVLIDGGRSTRCR